MQHTNKKDKKIRLEGSQASRCLGAGVARQRGWKISVACLALAVQGCLVSAPALAWGDAGHEVIGLIADHYLDPAVRQRVAMMLAGDRSRLTPRTDIASEATWADKYRDSDRATTRLRFDATRNWHFVNLEIEAPHLQTACFGRPPRAPGRPASRGPAADCIVDKVDEFVAELQESGTSRNERLLALQFVLHLVGDLHQPLHTSDDRDEGGNEKTVSAPGMRPERLHALWDVGFVNRLGGNPRQIADELIAKITPAQRASWGSGTASDWALETFTIAKDRVYGTLPPPSPPARYTLSEAYERDAEAVTAAQLSKAGVRLAYVLNRALR